MKLIKSALYIALIGLTSCKSPEAKPIQPKNDTTKVLELAIRTAFYHQNLPELNLLKRSYHFKDSILFTSDSIPLSILPQAIDSLKFKIMSKNQIYSLIKAENDPDRSPNYLYIRTFEKSDTGFYVSLQSLGCFPFSGGGSIGIYIKKEKDSLFVNNTMSSSIN